MILFKNIWKTVSDTAFQPLSSTLKTSNSFCSQQPLSSSKGLLNIQDHRISQLHALTA